ncbi:unnamed protein product [Calicophoron daubneyi]|uniref:Uncharacterized protein n=1 Tax=Calicophoron daubneyi TaxID=300641 RepID=A0AAV2TEJ1_CALDB
MVPPTRVEFIIKKTDELSLCDLAQFTNFLRHRLMDMGVLADERKEKTMLSDRLGSRPWLDPNALKLKASLADAVRRFSCCPNPEDASNIKEMRRLLVEHLHRLHLQWAQKMFLCRTQEQRDTVRILKKKARETEKPDEFKMPSSKQLRKTDPTYTKRPRDWTDQNYAANDRFSSRDEFARCYRPGYMRPVGDDRYSIYVPPVEGSSRWYESRRRHSRNHGYEQRSHRRYSGRGRSRSP